MPKPAVNTSANRSPGNTPAIGAAWAGLSLAALAWSLWGMTMDRSGAAEAAAHNARMLWPFWIASASCWIGLTMIWRTLRSLPGQHAFCRHRAAMIIGVALAARAVVLCGHDPALSDDAYRYVFDGRNLACGLNPYLTDPEDRVAALASGGVENWPGERKLLSLLAYPEITTPYLPVSQYVFAALGKACEWGGWTSPTDSARVFRIGFTLIEVGMMFVLALALRRRGLSPWWLALYAWHPLSIDGVAASGHQDVIGIALMIMAMTLFDPFLVKRKLSAASAAALLAMSAMVKPIAALAGMMSLRRKPLVAWCAAIIVGAIVVIALALPLHWRPDAPAYQAWRGTADWMAEKAAHFSGLYEPVLCVVRHAMPDGPDRKPGFNLDQEWLARKICLWTLAGVVLIAFMFARDAWRATAAAMLALALCSTTCHPWYLLWALALFPLARGGWTLWTYSLTISWGYAVFITGKGHAFGVEWTVAPWVIAMAYIPLLIALVADGCACFGSAKAQPQAAER